MKKIFILLTIIMMAVTGAIGQAPGLFNYQGVARNSVGNVLVNRSITLRLTIHDGTPTGAIVYRESRSLLTNPFGLFNAQVGGPGASAVTGTIAGVPWGIGNKYLQVEIDDGGGTGLKDIGTVQLASVPYSLFSATSGDLVLPFIRTQAASGSALIGLTNSATTGTTGAIEATSASTDANAVAIRGTISSTAPGGFSAGVRGVNNGISGLGIGVYGSQNGSGWGVYGTSVNAGGIGVNGVSTAGTGVNGTSNTGTGGRFTTTSGLALYTTGGVRLQGISEGANRILTSDATGNATWQLPAPATDLVLPFNKTQNEPGFLFRLTNSGTTATSSAIEGVTNSQVANVSAVVGTVSSVSPGSLSAGVRGINNGTTGTGVGVYGSHAGNGFGIYGTSNGIGIYGETLNSTGVLGTSIGGDGVGGYSLTGTGVYGTSDAGEAGFFELPYSTNTSDALTASTFGPGDAVVGINRGTGRAGFFRMLNAVSTADAVRVNQIGLGHGVYASILNTSNGKAALHGDTDAPGPAVLGRTSGTGNAASFLVLNPTHTNAAMNVATDGRGSGITVRLTNGLNNARGIDVLQGGVGQGVFATSAGGNGVWGITSSGSSAGVIGDNFFGEAVVLVAQLRYTQYVNEQKSRIVFVV